MRSRLTAALLAIGVAGSAVACSSSSAPPAASSGSTSGGSTLSGSITVLAATSLKGTFTTLVSKFQNAHPDARITLITGGSADLATTIDNNGPADVFASASTKTMKTVIAAGHATTSTDFAKNTMEIATQPGNPKKIASVQDLANTGLRVAVCKVGQPCGDAAAAVFAKAKVTVTPVTQESNVGLVLAKVEAPLQLADAGIVYVTDIKSAGSKVTGVEIPAAVNFVTTYPITVVKQATNPTVATAFMNFILSADGQAVLAAAGFQGP